MQISQCRLVEYVLNFSRSALISSGEGVMQGLNLSKQQKSLSIMVTLQSKKLIIYERKYFLTNVF